MADTPKNQGPSTAAKRGKVKGTGAVTPKAADQEAQEAPQSAPKVAPATKPGEGTAEYEAAYKAGLEASQRGTPSRPPLGYSDLEVKAWFAGYKSHANPDNDTAVEDITDGYRGRY